MKGARFEYDLAYGCFLLWGLTVLSISVIRASYTDAEWAGGAGGILLLLLPLILASFIAVLVGIVLSIRLWKHWPLLILAGISVLLTIMDFSTQYGSTAFRNAVSIVYGVGVAAMSGLWFLVLRRRHFPPAWPPVKE